MVIENFFWGGGGGGGGGGGDGRETRCIMVYVKLVNKRKFTYIIKARLHASEASCLKCKPVQQVWKGD